MTISSTDAKQFARAIAVANGHPEPDAWAAAVADAFGTPEIQPEVAAQNVATENTLQQETPAV